MAVEIVVPQAGESITEAMIGQWFKADGALVEKDEPLLEFETDKSNLELVAERAGRLSIRAAAGEVVRVGQVVGTIEAVTESPGERDQAPGQPKDAAQRAEAPPVMPAAARLAAEKGVDPVGLSGSGRGGRVLKEDVQRAVDQQTDALPATAHASEAKAAVQPPGPVQSPQSAEGKSQQTVAAPPTPTTPRGVRRVPMSMLRRRVAQRLVEAQHTAAILSTFNEVDMSALMDLRARYGEAFQKRHGNKLGFMSFFVKACVEALKAIPEINAQIEEQTIVYRDFCDIGVAVGTERGLVVPVIRDAHLLSLAQIEQVIADYAVKARNGRISLDDLSGGTFTISNGGVYGSLLSTPILNPPQSGILGMHKIEKRPVVVNDQIVIRPMMYVALSYDHRIVDGKEAVTFLVRVKETLEDPARLLLEL
jgi:2-oxoglutarate dehydrogenase E2 component (dihydrolipoamide succinyltransferase)